MCILCYLEGNLYIYPTILSPAILLLYLCFVLLSRSCSVFDHNLCAWGYSEVFVVVKGCSVSVWSTGVGRGMVPILLGGAGLGTTSKDCRTLPEGGWWYFVAVISWGQ